MGCGGAFLKALWGSCWGAADALLEALWGSLGAAWGRCEGALGGSLGASCLGAARGKAFGRAVSQLAHVAPEGRIQKQTQRDDFRNGLFVFLRGSTLPVPCHVFVILDCSPVPGPGRPRESTPGPFRVPGAALLDKWRAGRRAP